MEVFYSVLLLLAGVGVFLCGIVMFTETITRGAGGRMRVLFKRTCKNRVSSFGLGLGATVAMQSSTATTVMVVGLVNAGLLTLFQSTAVIFGANLGSAVTTLLLSLGTLDLRYIFMSMAFAGAFIRLISRREKLRFVASLLLAFGLIFSGMNIMSGGLRSDPTLTRAITDVFASIDFPLLLILIGMLFTVVTQSTHGTLALMIVMMNENLLTFNSAIFILLGASIGTTSTALLVSIGANTNARRAAFTHFMFNVLGVTMVTMIIWPLQGVLVPAFTNIVTDPAWQAPVFNVIYNMFVASILIFFIVPLNKFTIWAIREKKNDKEIIRPKYIDREFRSDTMVALGSVISELKDMMERARNNMVLSFDDFINRRTNNKDEILQGRKVVAALNDIVTEYLVDLSGVAVSGAVKDSIGEFYRFSMDIDRMIGHTVFMHNNTVAMKENMLKFDENIDEELTKTYEKIYNLYNNLIEIIETKEGRRERFQDYVKYGDSLKKTFDGYADGYLDLVANNVFDAETGKYYYNTMISFRSIASYLTKIAETLDKKYSKVIEG